MTAHRYTCPCCGYMTLGDWPGSYEICHVCFWEDDAVQLLDPWYDGGANVPCLIDAQAAFTSCGAMEKRFVKNVKGVHPGDVLDPQWRKVVSGDRAFARLPRELSDEEFQDLNALYYWRRNAA